ncbi:MAG TPA: hypothetical protein ENG87_05875 [Candidatus Pacearchaeota archaeon]|nr:hypothetical protein [Candidatus Pacearchaeota archaeon]
MKFAVLAQSFDPYSGVPTSNPMEEIVDTKENIMFKNMTNILQIHDKYEDFWNHLNNHPKELVFVQSIRKV